MHKKLHALIISTIITGSLLCPYVANAKTADTPNHAKKIIQLDKHDNLGLIKGHLADNKTKDMKGVVEFFKENTDLFHIENPEAELKLVNVSNDKVGNTHVRVQQIWKGEEIFGNQYIIHYNKEGCIYSVNGKLTPDISKKYSASKDSYKINESKAIDIAKKSVNVSTPAYNPTAKSYIFNLDGEYLPVYEVKLSAMEPEVSNWTVYVSRETGDVVKKLNRSETVSTETEGTGVLGDKKTITVDSSNGKYSLVDNKSGVTVKTYDGSSIKTNNTTWISYLLPGTLYTKSTPKFNDEKDKAAVDAHAYGKVVYNYYKNEFGRNSLDNKGMDIKSTVHVGTNWKNAMWNGEQMVYGDGDGVTVLPLSGGVDVVAHELTHGVDTFSANLDYEEQSGALNESFSDVFGTLIKFDYRKGNATYLVGEDIWTPGTGKALRDMENPDGPKGARPQPAHMKDYVQGGNVHVNSGIPNKAACIVMKTIGHEKTAQIYYNALTAGLRNDSDFRYARLILIEKANDLFGENSTESQAVANAFDTVGIQ